MGTKTLDVDSRIDSIVMRGRKVAREIAENVIAASVSMSTEQISEITVDIADPELLIARSGHVTINASVSYEEMRLVIASMSLYGGPSGTGGLKFQARSDIIARLKNRQGPQTVNAMSPSEYVRLETEACGGTAVVQPMAPWPIIMRDTEAADAPHEEGAETKSSWTTFMRLAKQQGCIVFDVGRTIYFGKPTWFIKNPIGPALTVGWLGVPPEYRPLSIPECRMSADADFRVEITVELPWTRAIEARPGRPLRLLGMPGFTSTYLITRVDFSLAGTGPVTVTAVTPHDPDPEDPNQQPGANKFAPTEIAGQGKYKIIVDAAMSAKFTGEALVLAVAISIAENGGFTAGVKTDAVGDNHDGTHDYGLWQINTVHRPPPDGDGTFDILRYADPYYNAKYAYIISNKGTDWYPWYTFDPDPTKSKEKQKNWNSKYKDYMADARAAIRYGALAEIPDPAEANDSRSALQFVWLCEAQKGDAYGHIPANEDNPNPDTFDAAELVEWACARVGVTFRGNAKIMHDNATPISAKEAANTRGALLFRIYTTPYQGISGHVAISLGTGDATIEAVPTPAEIPGSELQESLAPGVGYGHVYHGSISRFESGGLIPNMIYSSNHPGNAAGPSAGTAIRVANSLLQLLAEINAKAPNRNKAADGTLGDDAHAARISDHNPNAQGVVRAMDITHDPANGCDANIIAANVRSLGAAGDPRVLMVIWNHQIATSRQNWAWRTYHDANPHDKHVHISVAVDAAGYDSTAAWNVA